MPGEVLVTAHHAEDQAQTFLLQAFRGSGVDGLAAMPAATDFGPGRHARPMLAIGRDAIRAYAQEHALDWLDDPSNVDPSVDRAYLDTHVWPVISRHWPSAAATLSRAAALCAESAILAREQADTDLAFCVGDSPDCLSVSRLAGLSSNRRRNLLRRWLEMRDLPSPRHRHLAHIESDCLDVVRDARPCVAWRGAEVRRYRDGLYAMPTLPTASGRWSAVWTPPEPLPLPGGGTLVAECGAGGLVPDRDYRVRLRRGGERVRLPGRAHDTALKTALQEAGVPPWARERLPLIVAGERIAAVADLWICEGFATDTGDYGWCPHWRDPPPGWPAVVDGAGRSC